MRSSRLQHVSTPYPIGTEEEVRAFYGRVLGLVEKPVPESLQGGGLVWFAAGDGELELHFLPDPVPPDQRAQRHFCLEVGDLAGCRERLAQAGFDPYDATAIPNRPRFFCRDPFGNLLEFTTIVGDYRKEQAL
jgi:catechol 2,3-dioxygenase-like lactoylglutathione lyase family enzyme